MTDEYQARSGGESGDAQIVSVCPRCDGCGQLADTDRREPWTAWTDLPVYAAAAVFAGVVKPIPCDVCAPTQPEVTA